MNQQPFRDRCGPVAKDRIQIGPKYAVVLLGLLLAEWAVAQQPCPRGMRIDGMITDPTGAVIPGARVQAANGATAVTDGTGHYVLPCVPGTRTTITAAAEGFAGGAALAQNHGSSTVHVNLQLAVAAVQTNVDVNGSAGGDSSETAGTIVLGTEQVQSLSDDPDDLLRDLQELAASSGGPPENAVISVDGFQHASSLPPKASISQIRVNPDPFSSEYETAPWRGGRIEVTTKPGASAFHGALFFVDSDSVFNATDPLSVSATPAGKQRYGFELGGPVRGKNTDFFLALERRNIHEFNVVDAVTLDAGYNPAPFEQTAAAPQKLWIGSARADWQITPKDAVTLSFSSNSNSLRNQGIGGLLLGDAGFNSLTRQYDVRLLNTRLLSNHLLNETRIAYSWRSGDQAPLSAEPSLLVAGFFTGGGSTSGNLNNRERDLEVDDDCTLSRGKHTLKAGLQSFGSFLHNNDPDTFNGAYVFGGGSAPALDANNNPTGQVTTISAIEQYRRALLSLPGGRPTTFQITTGIPVVPVTQWRLAFYIQDTTKLRSRLTLSSGLRYQLQTTPDSFRNLAPRLSVAWTPDKKSNWLIRLSAGLFNNPLAPAYAMQVDRLNGVRQQETTIYSPNFQNPTVPVNGSVGINTTWQFPKALAQLPSLMAQAGVGHDFPHHWHLEADFDYGAAWNQMRQVNINAPMVASSTGAPPNPIAALLAQRPIVPNQNIFRYEELAHQLGKVIVISLRQYSFKRFGFSTTFLRMIGMRSDGGFRTGDTAGAASPQSSYSEQGESARADWATPNLFLFTGNLKLPLKFELSPLLNATSGRPYNITTGTDANGDGDFNDRPSYATAPGAGVYPTPFGLLSTNTVNGDVPRNLGTMRGLVHLETNLSRAFILNPGHKDHPRTLTINARSTNLLNHTNVTAVNTILSSGALGQAVAAETARRVELGVRFAF